MNQKDKDIFALRENTPYIKHKELEETEGTVEHYQKYMNSPEVLEHKKLLASFIKTSIQKDPVENSIKNEGMTIFHP